jgi:hypothetical protein
MIKVLSFLTLAALIGLFFTIIAFIGEGKPDDNFFVVWGRAIWYTLLIMGVTGMVFNDSY